MYSYIFFYKKHKILKTSKTCKIKIEIVIIYFLVGIIIIIIVI